MSCFCIFFFFLLVLWLGICVEVDVDRITIIVPWKSDSRLRKIQRALMASFKIWGRWNASRDH